MFKLGYNTNGLPHHRWEDALALIAEAGYQSVALTVDHHCLNPFADGWRDEVDRVRDALQNHGLSCVIETGARFLLNPRIKHEPTLVSANAGDRSQRVEFLKRCIDIAEVVGAGEVSFWSGVRRAGGRQLPEKTVAMQWLTAGCREVADYAAPRDIRLAFEPEPGMFIETFADFAELRDAVAADNFGLTIDVGHVHCLGDGNIGDRLREWGHLLFNVHIEDMVRGVHEHLPFGAGEIDFPPVLKALKDIGYSGGVHVELSRNGHAGPQMLEESFAFLTGLMRDLDR